ncbi:MAG: sensor histidine kinase [Bacteroidales bacterium]|jgi:hypothetical protein|nr:sensor histidine kinase [Bacteroidales bacterium]
MKKTTYIIHVLIWVFPVIYILFLTDNFIIGVFSRAEGNLKIPLLYGTLLNMLLFYSISFYIIPHYFKKTKYLLCTFYIFGLLITITLLESLMDLFYIKINTPERSYAFFNNLVIGNLVIHIVFLGLSLADAFSRRMIQEEKNKQELVKEKLNTEIAYLKSQINPHFLFNILNNLFSLAYKNKDQATADGILKLSKMMRYMLYEGNKQKIPLSKEVDYLENYIDLQKMRFHPKDDIQIRMNKHGSLDSFLISPLLLIPFVENAFKHGISIENQSKIDLSFHLAHGIFNFSIQNTNHQTKNKKQKQNEYSGFGLNNVKNRLELLYQERHNLVISDHPDMYEVRLTLKE